jgi:hypothetical protein
MNDSKNEGIADLVFCNKCENYCSNEYEDECHAPDNFKGFGSYSQKVKYWKQSPGNLNIQNSCQWFMPKNPCPIWRFLLRVVLPTVGFIIFVIGMALAILHDAGRL